MTTREEFVQNLIDSELMSPSALQDFIQGIPASDRPNSGKALARCLVKHGLLTQFQATTVLEGQFSRLFIGQYQVLEKIGAGGMGAVYKARHRRMDRTVAVKLITHGNDSADLVIRFEREVRVISGLQHPNIVIAHDADECEAGPFLVMEYVPGSDLELIVRRHGPLSVAEALDCTLQSALGLAYAHAQGVIHRDIKPANLLRVTETGCVKITDLGLARFKDDPDLPEAKVAWLTETGNIVGTVLFMSPEQSAGSKAVDHRCDVYSLGCTLFFLLHGTPPFVGESRVDTVLLHREGPIPSLRDRRSDVPESLDGVFQRMVAKSPDDRFQAMTEVVAALQAFDLDPTIAAEPPAPVALPEGTPDITEEYRTDARTAVNTSALLIERSGAQAIVIQDFLKALGIDRIHRCRTGGEALQALSQLTPDVVVSAMHLDDMTGLELAQRIRADSQHEPIGFILISSLMDAASLKEEPGETGITLLAKPFDQAQLDAALHTVTTIRSARK